VVRTLCGAETVHEPGITAETRGLREQCEVSSRVGGEEEKEKIGGSAVDRTEIYRTRQTSHCDERGPDRRSGVPPRSVKKCHAVHGRGARKLLTLVDAGRQRCSIDCFGVGDGRDELPNDLSRRSGRDPNERVLRQKRGAQGSRDFRWFRWLADWLSARTVRIQPRVDFRHPESPLATDFSAGQLSAPEKAVERALGELQAIGNLLERQQIGQGGIQILNYRSM
jgi:hypothetical protein